MNWEVFASIQMKYKNNRNRLMQNLEKMSPKFSSSINDFTTPLHVTAAKGYYEISEYLLTKNRKQIYSLDKNNWSPLHNASMNGHHKIVHILLSNGAKIDQSNNEGYIPLLESCNTGHLKVTEILLKHHANINRCENNGRFPLHIVAQEGFSDIITLLVKKTRQR